MTEINVYKIGKSPEELQAALMTLRSEYDAHIHDGVSSKTFQTTIADTISTRTMLIRKLSYTDDTNGLWMGLVSNLMKLNLGSATNYLKWDGTALTISGSITAATITGSTIQTALTGARIVIDAGNDITLYDASVTNGSTVSGNSSTINFLRDYDNTKGFKIRQRVGKNNTGENVFELYGLPPASGYSNYIYIGRQGYSPDTSETGYIEISPNILTARSANVSNGAFAVSVSTNSSASSSPHVWAGDARIILGAGVSGVISYINGTGTNGVSGIAYNNLLYLYVTSGGLKLGGTITPDASNTYDIGNSGVTIRSLYVGTRVQSVIGYFTGKITGETDIEAYQDITVGRILKLGQVARATAEAISSPANGWTYYDTTNNVIRVYTHGSWKTLTPA